MHTPETEPAQNITKHRKTANMHMFHDHLSIINSTNIDKTCEPGAVAVAANRRCHGATGARYRGGTPAECWEAGPCSDCMHAGAKQNYKIIWVK